MVRIMKLAACGLAFGSLLMADPAFYLRHGSLVSQAEAMVGRPATPVSVAGVARRTTRRCVADVAPC